MGLFEDVRDANSGEWLLQHDMESHTHTHTHPMIVQVKDQTLL